ncbi:hypothetical protein Tco_1278766 [Tanacetum coccineum]
MMNGGVEYPRTHSTSPSETYAPYKPSPRIDSFEQPSCLRSTFVSEALRKSDQMHQTFKKSSLTMTHKSDDMIELSKSQSKKTYKEDLEYEVDNPSPQSTPQVLLSFEAYTPPMTHPEEVEETIEILMEVEPFNQTQLEDLGLNTCSHDLSFSFREVPKVDEPKPQSLSKFPSLDVIFDEKKLWNS